MKIHSEVRVAGDRVTVAGDREQKEMLPSGYLLHSYGKSIFFIGEPSINAINGPFSMAMLNNQMVPLFCQRHFFH